MDKLKITDSTSGKEKTFLFSELYKIQDRKKATLYWLDDSRGVYLYKPSGIWGKFTKKNDRKLFYQYTLDDIKLM